MSNPNKNSARHERVRKAINNTIGAAATVGVIAGGVAVYNKLTEPREFHEKQTASITAEQFKELNDAARTELQKELDALINGTLTFKQDPADPLRAAEKHSSLTNTLEVEGEKRFWLNVEGDTLKLQYWEDHNYTDKTKPTQAAYAKFDTGKRITVTAPNSHHYGTSDIYASNQQGGVKVVDEILNSPEMALTVISTDGTSPEQMIDTIVTPNSVSVNAALGRDIFDNHALEAITGNATPSSDAFVDFAKQEIAS